MKHEVGTHIFASYCTYSNNGHKHGKEKQDLAPVTGCTFGVELSVITDISKNEE